MLTPSEFIALAGSEIGRSGWLTIDQTMIDAFADVTMDHQFIHVDPARAIRSGLSGTIAHGFLSLSLISHLAEQCLPRIEGAAMGLNYGFDKVRFLAPVASGSRVRARFLLDRCERRNAHELRNTFHVTMDIEGQDKPALFAEWLTLTVLSAD